MFYSVSPDSHSTTKRRDLLRMSKRFDGSLRGVLISRFCIWHAGQEQDQGSEMTRDHLAV